MSDDINPVAPIVDNQMGARRLLDAIAFCAPTPTASRAGWDTTELGSVNSE